MREPACPPSKRSAPQTACEDAHYSIAECNDYDESYVTQNISRITSCTSDSYPGKRFDFEGVEEWHFDGRGNFLLPAQLCILEWSCERQTVKNDGGRCDSGVVEDEKNRRFESGLVKFYQVGPDGMLHALEWHVGRSGLLTWVQVFHGPATLTIIPFTAPRFFCKLLSSNEMPRFAFEEKAQRDQLERQLADASMLTNVPLGIESSFPVPQKVSSRLVGPAHLRCFRLVMDEHVLPGSHALLKLIAPILQASSLAIDRIDRFEWRWMTEGSYELLGQDPNSLSTMKDQSLSNLRDCIVAIVNVWDPLLTIDPETRFSGGTLHFVRADDGEVLAEFSPSGIIPGVSNEATQSSNAPPNEKYDDGDRERTASSLKANLSLAYLGPDTAVNVFSEVVIWTAGPNPSHTQKPSNSDQNTILSLMMGGKWGWAQAFLLAKVKSV